MSVDVIFLQQGLVRKFSVAYKVHPQVEVTNQKLRGIIGCLRTILSENEVFMNSTFSVLRNFVLDSNGHLDCSFLQLILVLLTNIPVDLDF